MKQATLAHPALDRPWHPMNIPAKVVVSVVGDAGTKIGATGASLKVQCRSYKHMHFRYNHPTRRGSMPARLTLQLFAFMLQGPSWGRAASSDGSILEYSVSLDGEPWLKSGPVAMTSRGVTYMYTSKCTRKLNGGCLHPSPARPPSPVVRTEGHCPSAAHAITHRSL